MNQPMPLRVGVVGAGMMGSNHARVYGSLKDTELAAIVDTNFERAKASSRAYGGQPYSDWSEIVGAVDAVSVVTPSSMHEEVAIPLLEAGIHCLVEKPLAPDPEGCRSIISAANRSSALLMVGHLERFNPAVVALKKVLQGSPEHIYAIEANRKSALSARVDDVDVVTDLMIHDLDIVLDLIGESVTDVTARSPVGPEGNVGDFTTAMLTFSSGQLACLTASRVTQNHIRELQVTTENRLLTLDYSSQDLNIHRQGQLAPIDEPAQSGDFIVGLRSERVIIQRQEPLIRELEAFLNAIRGGYPSPVSGSTALKVMEIASEIQSQLFNPGAPTQSSK